jgi:hypothetical protein
LVVSQQSEVRSHHWHKEHGADFQIQDGSRKSKSAPRLWIAVFTVSELSLSPFSSSQQSTV